MDEIWREIPELGVTVSNYGNVKEGGIWCRPHMSGKGYLRVSIKGEPYLVHRLVMWAFEGPCPDGYEVGHQNNVPTDNRYENLKYVTSSENTLHAVESGRWPIGERRWNSVLTEEMVKLIRQMHTEGNSVASIAKLINVNPTTVYHVVKRHNWRHVA